MTHSESINELAAALAKAQAVIEGAEKAGFNPHFKSKYADLASIWDACRAPLASNGLSVAQSAETGEDGRVGVTTLLMHASGQWVESTLAMKPTKDDPQGVGSCLTYARRYSLAAMVGVAPEDDDGNAASARQPATATAATPKKPDGYDAWVGVLEGIATEGYKPLEQAFKASKAEYRDYRTKFDNARHEALKKLAETHPKQAARPALQESA